MSAPKALSYLGQELWELVTVATYGSVFIYTLRRPVR